MIHCMLQIEHRNNEFDMLYMYWVWMVDLFSVSELIYMSHFYVFVLSLYCWQFFSLWAFVIFPLSMYMYHVSSVDLFSILSFVSFLLKFMYWVCTTDLFSVCELFAVPGRSSVYPTPVSRGRSSTGAADSDLHDKLLSLCTVGCWKVGYYLIFEFSEDLILPFIIKRCFFNLLCLNLIFERNHDIAIMSFC